MSTDDTTADGWTYNEDRDNILDQDGFAPDITTEQWRTLLHFIATHGPAIVAGRDPVADAECERDEARAAVEALQSRVCVLENECAAAEQESFDSDEQARADMAKIAELEAAMAEVERLLETPSDGKIRDAAVEIVDRIFGYTCEYSSHRETHQEMYDMAERAIRAALPGGGA